MNHLRIAYASIAAFMAYFVLGGLTFLLLPSLKNEFQRYPAVYRDQAGQMSMMPFGMVAMFVAIVAITVLFAMLRCGGSGFVEGARFGAVISVFIIGSSVAHDYVNLNIGLKLTLISAVANLIQWLVTGIIIGLIYKPIEPR